MNPSKTKKIAVFSGTFISALMFVMGISILSALFFPAVAQIINPINFQPQLPIAAARDESFLDANTLPATQLFPPLTETSDVASGNWIRIPAIGVNVPLVLSASIDDLDILATLDSGAALYPNGVSPGELGNTFVSAHSTGEPWKGKYRFAFLRLNEVDPGNQIHLDYNGTRYTYKVTHTRIVKPDPNFRVLSDRPVPTMTLMACWPLWTTDKRMLKHAELTNITQLSSPKIAQAN